MLNDLGKQSGPPLFDTNQPIAIPPVPHARQVETEHILVQDIANRMLIPPHMLNNLPPLSNFKGLR